MSTLPKLIVILGPTASGKTDLVLKLARKFGGEIVSADSRQIYRGMNVGTGKVIVEAKRRHGLRQLTPIVSGGVAHYLIDVANPDDEFTAADYKKMAVAAIWDILKRRKQPFLIGGTGLYIQAVVDNLEIPHVLPNKKLRAQFEKELEKVRKSGSQEVRKSRSQKVRGSEILKKWYEKLLKLDPGAKDAVDKNNPRRIIRALEVCLATGQPFSKLREKGEPLFDVLQIGVDAPRQKLYERIDKRVEWMVEHGLIEETKKLLKKYNPALPAMSGIGYKEMGEYLSQKVRKSEGQKLLTEVVQKIKYRTHAYARRQMTWFRRDKRIKWIKSHKEAERKIVEWLEIPL